MALSAWDKTRVYGTWYTHDGVRIAGTYKATMPARVTVEDGEAIVPAGLYAEGDLNASAAGSPALDIMVPSNDDPDVTPLGWQMQLEVTLKTPGRNTTERYVIDTPVDGEVNLRTIPLAQTIPATQTMLLRGVAGGVAGLDRDGDVTNAAGDKVTGGGGGGDPLTSYATQVATLTDYPETFPADLSGLATVATTGSYDDLADKPAAPGGPEWGNITGALSAQTDLQDALDGKQAAGSYATAAQGALAETAVQPGDLPEPVNPADFATAAQGAKADTAVQPAAIADFITAAEIPAAPTWGTIAGKPAVVAEGASQTAARDAIGAGTSNLQLGTGSTTAKRGDYTPTVADVPNLPATKVTTGTFDAARIPALPYRAGDWTPGVADLPVPPTVTVKATGTTWPARPAGGTSITVQWVDHAGTAGVPGGAIEGHDLVIIPAGA